MLGAVALHVKAPRERMRRRNVDPVHAVLEKTHAGHRPRARGTDTRQRSLWIPRQGLRDMPKLSGKIVVDEQDIHAFAISDQAWSWSIGPLIAALCQVSFDVVAGVMVLSEVVERLMMMSGSDASTCPAECGQAASSRLTEVVATTVPAGHRWLGRTEPRTVELPVMPFSVGSIRTKYHLPRCNGGSRRSFGRWRPSPSSSRSALRV